MGLGQQVVALDVGVEDGVRARMRCAMQRARDVERAQLHGWVRSVVVAGLGELDDPGGDRDVLIALAGAQARRLRAELESAGGGGALLSMDAHERRAREDEREWVRGHLHDTALQILEFIAGDGFATGLSAQKIANLAAGAARDLCRWIDADARPADARLGCELTRVTATARTFDPNVRLVGADSAVSATPEQVLAIAGAVREAVTNARKHARASQVVVGVQIARDGQTVVTVTDDGVGFDREVAARGRGLGVKCSILARMRRVGGHAWLQDAPGGGTLVKLVTPSPGR